MSDPHIYTQVIVLFDFIRFHQYIHDLAITFKNCRFPNVLDFTATCDEIEAFSNIDYALLINSNHEYARNKTVQEIIIDSALLFQHFGRFLNSYSPKQCKVIISDCHANLNAYFCRSSATSFPGHNITTVLAISQNRAAAQIGLEIRTPPWGIRNIIVWGNSCFYQFCDVKYASFGDQKVTRYASEHWRRHCLPKIVQRRSVDITMNRCMPPIMSLANSVVQHLLCLHRGTPTGEWITMGVISDGSYGIDEGLFFGFPVRVVGGRWEIVPNLQLDEFTEENIQNSLRSFKHRLNLVLSSVCQ